MATQFLIGSVESMPSQTFLLSVNGGGAFGLEVPTGNWYLEHGTSTKSLCAYMAFLLTAGALNTVTVYLTKAGKVKIDSPDADLNITWNTATTLRDLLGFSGSSTGSGATHVATNYSPLFWSPGKRALLKSIPGVHGMPEEDLKITQNGDGTRMKFTYYGTKTTQDFSWDAIPANRFWTTSEAGGEYKTFRTRVLMPGARFIYYDSISEDRTSTTTAGITTSSYFGPYKINDRSKIMNFLKRKDPRINTAFQVDFSCNLVEEYT